MPTDRFFTSFVEISEINSRKNIYFFSEIEQYKCYIQKETFRKFGEKYS